MRRKVRLRIYCVFNFLRERADSKKSLLQAVNLNLPDNLAGEAKKVLAELN